MEAQRLSPASQTQWCPVIRQRCLGSPMAGWQQIPGKQVTPQKGASEFAHPCAQTMEAMGGSGGRNVLLSSNHHASQAIIFASSHPLKSQPCTSVATEVKLYGQAISSALTVLKCLISWLFTFLYSNKYSLSFYQVQGTVLKAGIIQVKKTDKNHIPPSQSLNLAMQKQITKIKMDNRW